MGRIRGHARFAGFPVLWVALNALRVGLVDCGIVTAVLNAAVQDVLRVFVFGEPQGAFLLVAYFAGDRPTPQQACVQKCAALNKGGHLVYRGPATPKDFYKEANSECECR